MPEVLGGLLTFVVLTHKVFPMKVQTVVSQVLMACCLCILLFAIGCGAPSPEGKAGSIQGTIKGISPDTEIILRSFNRGNLVNVGKAVADSTGYFELTPDRPLAMGYHQLVVDRSLPLVLITDSTEALYVEVEAQRGRNYLVDASISGSPQSAKVADFYNAIMPLQARMKNTDKKGRSVDAETRNAAKELKKSQTDSLSNLSLAFAKAHTGTLSALSALEGLDPKVHGDLFKETLSALKGIHSQSHYFKLIQEKMVLANAPRTLDMSNPPKRKGKNSKFGMGDLVPDIVMNDPEGKERKLSDLRGKVVLLDFWASWCGPCRRENPTVVRAYEQYKDKGFEVFSVSLDSDAARWKKAIEQDQLSWPNHVSDLAGWRNAAAREYGVSSIPHTMLIDRDGTILATHLRGNALESTLRGVFGK